MRLPTLTLLVALLAAGNATAADPADWSRVVARAMPSVVNISVIERPINADTSRVWIVPGVVRNPATDLLSKLRDRWRGEKPDFKTVGAGGVIGDGLDVLTVAHVTDGGQAFRVQLASGEWRIARLVGQDLAADVALLRMIEGGPAKPVRPANLTRVRPGQPVLALGAPMGMGHSVSAGIVSAWREDNYFRVGRFLQIDAPVAGGNSGGPVVDARGQLLGLVSYGMRGGPQFIVPADRALRVAKGMRTQETVGAGPKPLH